MAGKIDLVSLIHLFNLSLHLYTEKLHEVGVPKYDGKIQSDLETLVHTHKAHLHNTQALK